MINSTDAILFTVGILFTPIILAYTVYVSASSRKMHVKPAATEEQDV